MKPNHVSKRSAKGAGIAIVTLMIGMCLIASLGLFTFEMLRHNTCYNELRSAAESAALAGAAAMASSDDPVTANTRDAARTAAYTAFKANSVVGESLSGADISGMNSTNYSSYAPAPNASAIFVEFLDPTSGAVITDDNSPKGRIVRVSAAFTNEPPFGKYLGIPSVPMRARADSQVPQLDVVMAFDTSGSIDDQTQVTMVARLKNGTKCNYQVQGQDTVYNLMQPPASGTSFNAAPPQGLSLSSNGWSFSTSLRGGSGGNDSSPPSQTSAPSAKTFSDCVVNLDGNQVFGGISITSGGVTYNFPDVATLVEAQRGNLEDATTASHSWADVSVSGGVTPQAGYQAAYINAAINQTQPISAARQAAIQFFQIMNNNTDAHFGFVSFSTAPHQTLTDNMNDYKFSSNWTGPGTINVKQPGIQLDQSNDNFTSIVTNCIPPTEADGSTNFGDTLQDCVDQLTTSKGKVRPLAKKAILFFTDGQPTAGPSWGGAAATAKTEQIQIYTIGLAQCSAIIPGECENLNAGHGQAVTYIDPNTHNPGSYTPSGDGMAASGASGGRFFLVVNTQNLRYVFENIARSLVQLTKNQ